MGKETTQGSHRASEVNLSNVDPYLPSAVVTEQAKRIQKFLQHVDQKLKHPCCMTLYGSAAVALFLADTTVEYEPNFTRDIDIAHMEPEEIDRSEFENESVDPPLYFQAYDVERWLVHPEWENSTVDFTKFIATSQLQIRLLHPIDLIITKLERADPKDLEDGLLLFERYPEKIPVITRRVREAAECYPLSRRVVSQVAYSFAGIFETEIDLRDLL